MPPQVTASILDHAIGLSGFIVEFLAGEKSLCPMTLAITSEY
jgi:hypothetical protein